MVSTLCLIVVLTVSPSNVLAFNLTVVAKVSVAFVLAVMFADFSTISLTVVSPVSLHVS